MSSSNCFSDGNVHSILATANMDRKLHGLLTLPAATYNSIGGESSVLDIVYRRIEAMRTTLLNNPQRDWHVLSRRCDICRQHCPSAQELITHRFTHTIELHVTCLICCRTFTSVQGLRMHVLKGHSYPKGKPAKFYKAFNSSSESVTERKLYVCDICHKPYSMSYIVIHKRTHTEGKSFKCEICHKRFMTRYNFESHKRQHTGDKPYKCEICHKRFSDRSNFEGHKRIHNRDKPYKCMVCHKRFRLNRGLKVHIRVHIGDKPYKC